MDKYETGIRIKEIRNLYKADDFASAAQLAKDIDWSKVKSWDALAMMMDVYEQTGDNDNARDMAVLAYNRNLGGKRLVYRLTDLLIKMGELDDAKELYKEYCSIARNSSDRHILNYHLLRAEKAPDEELITALENYRDGEVDERYMYRLAQLYAKNGDTDKCINTCDDIALWFKDGEYAQGAVKLKKRVGGALTPAQEELFKKSKVLEEELSKTQQITFADQLELNEERFAAEIDEALNDGAEGKEAVKEAEKVPVKAEEGFVTKAKEAAAVKAGESAGVFSSLLKKAFGADEEPEFTDGEEEEPKTAPDIGEKAEVKAEEIPVADTETKAVEEKDNEIESIISGILKDDEKNPEEEKIKTEETIEDDIPWNFNNVEEAFEPESAKETVESAQVQEPTDEVKEPEKDSAAEAPEGVKMSENIKETEDIEQTEAAKETDASESPECEKEPENPEETAIRENLTVGVMEIMKEEKALRGQGVIDEEEQIEGQLNMEDWLNEVREQKYGKQNTKEYSRSELERMLDEKDEKSKAYDKLMEEQKRLASEEGKPFDEEGAKQKVEQQMITDAARTDLTIRTGKATAKLENENKFINGEKSVDEKILKVMIDSVQEEVKKGNLTEAPEDRLKRFETAVAGAAVTPDKAKIGTPDELPVEVVGTAAVLVDFLTGNYDPKDVKNKAAVPSVLMTGQEQSEEPAPEPVLTDVQEENVKDVKGSEKEKEPEEIKEPEITKEAKAEPAEEKAEITDDGEKPFEDIDIDQGLFKRNKIEEITPNIIQAELEGEESAVAERITSADAAADAILQRITGKVPVITPELEKELGIKPEENEDKKEEKVSAPLEEVEKEADKRTDKAEDKAPDKQIEEEDISIQPENFSDTAHIDKKTLREIIEATPEEDVKEEEVVKETTRIFGEDGTRNTVKLEEVLKTTSLPEGKREKVLSLFEEYYDFPEINGKVEEIIAAFPKESASVGSAGGNIILTDNGDMDMTTLAKDIAKAFSMISPDKKYKLVKTSGSNISGGGLQKVASKLNGSVLVIEDAADMGPEGAKELMDYLKEENTGTCVIMEDTLEKMNEFVSINKDLTKAFNHRIDMRDYTAEELVEIAKELAGRRNYVIDEDGRLALFMIVKEINSGKDPLTLDELDDIIADAAKRAKKRMKKNKDLGEPTITNSDFR